MKQNKLIKNLSFILLASLFASCEIGLGNAVDTEPPSITITNPPADAVIRESFALIGNWSDDGTIASVNVTLANVETSVKYGPYEAVFVEPEGDDENATGTWSCVIEPTSESFNIPDGNYEVTVEIQDEGEHTTRVIRSFSLDNTAPVIILERPGSIVGSTSMDTYGRNLTLEGMSSDAHDVNSLEISVYEDKDFTNHLETITITNVPPTINLPVANFEEGVDNAYSRIYKSTSILDDPAQTRYCRISAYDSAVKYPLDGSDPTDADEKGNQTNVYYLKDALSTAGILTDDCKISDIYDILTGNKTTEDWFIPALTENQVNNGAFIINPKNNPTYTVSVRKPLTKNGTDFDKTVTTDYVLYKGSPLTIEVSAGLDSYGMSNIQPYAIECDAYGNPLEGASPIPLAESSGETEVTSYKWSVTVTDDSGLINDHCYVIGIDGQDSIGNSILPKETGYGFYFDTKASVSIENLSFKINGGADLINENTIYLPSKNPADTNSYSTAEISGSVISTSGNPYIYVFVDEAQVAVVQLTSANKDASWNESENNGKSKYNFTTSFNTSAISASSADKEATLSVKIVNGTASKTETKKLFYDCTAPAIGTFNLTPVAQKYDSAVETGPVNPEIQYLNQTVSFDYSVKNEGNQLAKVTAQVYTKASGASEWTELESYKKSFTSDFENITAASLGTIDTTTIADNSQLKIALSVWDKSGNKNLKEMVYTVDQTTDSPAVLPSDPETSTLRIAKDKMKVFDVAEPDGNPAKKNYIETGTPLSLVAYDDDGIKSVNAKVETLSADGTTKEPGGIKEYAFDVTLPSRADVYTVTVTVTDVNDNVKAYTFGVRVITTKPIVTITKSATVVSTNSAATSKQITVNVNINSDQPDFTVVRKILLNNTVQTAYTKTFDKNYEEIQSGINEKPLTKESPYITDVINFTSELASGVYTLEYTVADTATREGTASDTFKVDNKTPEITKINIFDPLEKDGNNNYVNKTSYNFTGTAKDGESEESWQSGIKVIEYSIDDSSFAAKATGSGTINWTAVKDFNSLTEGQHTIYVRATDNVGNVSTAGSGTFWFDKSAPAAQITKYIDKDNNEHDLSQSSTEASRLFYYGRKFSLKGTASDTSPVALTSVVLKQKKENTEITIPLTINGQNWTAEGLPYKAADTVSDDTATEGTYTYTLTVTDGCGKVTSSYTQKLIVDNQAPEKTKMDWAGTTSSIEKIKIGDVTVPVIKGSSYTFTASSRDNGSSGVAKVEYVISKVDAGGTKTEIVKKQFDTAINDTLVLGTSSSDTNADLAEGKYEIKVTTTDNAGNSSISDAETFYVDQTAPVLTANTNEPVGYKKLADAAKKVTISGTLTETNGISGELSVSGGNSPSVSHTATTWTIEDTFENDGTADGTKTYTITATDVAGRTGTCTATVVIDTKAPVIDLTKVTVPVTDESKNTFDTEKSSFRFAGEDGSIKDEGSSSGLKQIYFIFADSSATAPEEKTTEAETDLQKSFSLTYKGGSWTTLQSFASYSSVFAADNQGKKKLWIKAYDNAGNSNVWTSKEFIYDTARPSISETGIGSDSTIQNGNFVLTASASDTWGIQSVVMKLNGTTIAPDTTGGTSWTIAKGTYADGNYDFIITATDKAGKTASVTRKVMIDATAPTINSISMAETPVTLNDSKFYTSKTLNFTVTPDTDVSGIASISYTTKKYENASSRTEGDWTDMIYQSSGSYTASVTLEEGENNIYFRIKDNAGNVRGNDENYKTQTIVIDTTAPSNLKVYNADGTEFTTVEIITPGKDMSGAKDLTFYLQATDLHGVKGFAFGKDQTTLNETSTTIGSGTANERTNVFEVTIPKDSQSTGDVYFTVSDKLGNKTNYSPFSLKIDNEAPVVSFTTPSGTDALNGNITISGKVTDHLGAASGSNDGKVMTINLWYSKTGTDGTWVQIDNTEGQDKITQGLTNTSENFSITHRFSSYNKLYNSSLGETEDSAGTVYVKAVATDEAGNSGSNTLIINLNRDKDRPTIIFDTVELKIDDNKMSSSNYAWLTGTTVLSGSITDDDGVNKLYIKSVDEENTETEWKQVTNLKTNGAWNYDIQDFYSSISDANEKANKANLKRTLYFKVFDNENTETSEYYSSEASSTLHGVYLKGSDGTTLGSSGDNTNLYLRVDTLDPTVSVDGIHLGEIETGKTASTQDYRTDFESVTLGGSNLKFQVKFTAKDANGIKTKTLTANFADGTASGTNIAGTVTASTTESDVYIASFTLDLTNTHKAINGKNGKLTLTLDATDNANNDSERSKEIDFDYEKPSITINRPLETATLSGAVTVSGMLSDNTVQKPSLYYAISTSNETSPFANETAASATGAAAVTSWTGINPATGAAVNQTTQILSKTRTINIKPYYKELVTSSLNWFLYLDGTDNTNHDNQLNDYIQNFGIATYEEINTGDTRFDTIINLYLWVKAVDVNGNENVVIHKIMADPQGMRPSLTVEAPEGTDSTSRTTTGGTITVNGTAEPKGTNVMKSIWIQVDSGSAVEYSTGGSTSWSEKVTADDGDHTLTVWAEDNSGNLSLKTTRYVKVDKYTPEISTVFFRQRTGNETITSSKEYTTSTYISGTWFLEITATDEAANGADGNISTLRLLQEDGTEITGTTLTAVSVTNHKATRKLQYKLTDAAGSNTYGELKYKVEVSDGVGTTTKDITVNFDNKNPVLADPASTIRKNVVQSNGFYTFGSTVSEASDATANQSGLNFVAFYFKNGTNIYDVMRNNSPVTDYKVGTDGLPWKSYYASRKDENTITLTASPSHIYKGGLVKINGVVYLISEVNDKDITISGTLDSELAVSTADFALAGVVNNTIQESAPQNPTDSEKRSTNENYFGYYPNPNNDDGDHIIEKLTSDGEWEALINSKNIPDGSIDIHYVAFDKAGNYASGSVTGATVANNQPRLAGVKIYVDYNGNGQFDPSDLYKTGTDSYNQYGEITVYNSLNNTVTKKSITKKVTSGTTTTLYYDPEPADEDKETGWNKLPTTLTVGAESAAAFMMKGKTKFVPEIVGGNGEITYSYTNKTASMKNTTAVPLKNTSNEQVTGSTDNTIVEGEIVLAVGDLLKAGESTSAAPDKFTFTFTDLTSLTAALEVYAGVNLKTTSAPTVTINPFYWTNFKDNSLYIENLSDYGSDVTYEDIWADTKGHIELESDWAKTSSYQSTAISGEYDADPKVSGIILIEGTASDTLPIEKLYFELPGMDTALSSITDKYGSAYCLSTDVNGLIAGRDFENGVGLEITKSEYTQDGHSIEWKLTWDTQKISDTAPARLDTAVKVYAQNVGTLKQDTSGTGDTSADGSTVYKPIVSSDQKQNTPGTTQTTSASKTAYYKMDIVPYIQYLDTTLSKKKTGHPSVFGRTAGGDYPVYYYSTKFTGSSEEETYKIVGFNIPSSSSSVTVGSTSTSSSVAVSYTANGSTVTSLNNINDNDATYNKQPNGINNNKLNDDVAVKVWNINSQTETSSKGDLTEVKMHSKDGTLSYAYIHNGGKTYKLYDNSSTDAISTFKNIDFIFDKNGNGAGIYCGTNYDGKNNAGHMKFTISNWGNPDTDTARNHSIDLESMAYWKTDNSDTVSAPERFSAPKLAASSNSNKNNIYLMYYDTVYKKLKFRAGQDITTSGNGSFVNLTDTKDSEKGYIHVKENDVNRYIKNGTSDINATYYSLAVVSGSATDGTDDVVVAVWVENSKLYYAYCTNPLNDSPSWTILEVKKLSGKADGVCAIAVDPDKQIHIAAYSSVSTGSLTYTYLNTYSACTTQVPEANTVYVDRYGTTGEFLTLDFAKNSSSGSYVPYIGYYANEMPKYAYLVSNSIAAGVAGESGTGDGNFYTGNWEEVILPTVSAVYANDKNNNINIALTRDTDGTKKTTSGPAASTNPVLGYAISYQGVGYLETAQLK